VEASPQGGRVADDEVRVADLTRIEGSSAVRALVIDDSRAMRLVLSRYLISLGYEVEQAANGQEALDVLSAAEDSEDGLPGVALVDWNMPVMNGLEFVTACRADRRLRSISLMMVTTESEQGQIVRALAAGAHEYLIKPFDNEALGSKLALLGLPA
jgi:two-component system chemotaxis response regulator CheY